jgi:hypothetical protein
MSIHPTYKNTSSCLFSPEANVVGTILYSFFNSIALSSFEQVSKAKTEGKIGTKVLLVSGNLLTRTNSVGVLIVWGLGPHNDKKISFS